MSSITLYLFLLNILNFALFYFDTLTCFVKHLYTFQYKVRIVAFPFLKNTFGTATFLLCPIGQRLCAQRNEKFLWGLKLASKTPSPTPLVKVKIWNPSLSPIMESEDLDVLGDLENVIVAIIRTQCIPDVGMRTGLWPGEPLISTVNQILKLKHLKIML